MQKLRHYAAAVSFAALLIATPALASNLVQNGGFETGDLTGWTMTPGNYGAVWTVSGSYPADGSFAAEEPNGNCCTYLSQVLTTASGIDLTLTFWMATWGELGDGATLSVYWDGVEIGGISTPGDNSGSIYYTPYNEYFYTIPGADVTGSDTLSFMAQSHNERTELDDIGVDTPEPSAWLLAMPGLLGLALLRKRFGIARG